MKPVVRCELLNIVDRGTFYSARVKVDESLGGETLITSKIKSIDFENGLIVTQNTIYKYEV